MTAPRLVLAGVLLFAVATGRELEYPCIQIGENLNRAARQGAVSVCGDGIVTVYVGAVLPRELIETPQGGAVTIRSVHVVR